MAARDTDPAFNRLRTEFNERVRDYAIQSGEHSAFTMANYIAYAILGPNKPSTFITDRELAAKLNMNLNTINRLRKKLIPLGLVVTLGKWKGNATECAISKPPTGDTLCNTQSPPPVTPFANTKPPTGDAQSPPSVAPKPPTGVDTLQESPRRIQERGERFARLTLGG